MTHPRLLAVAVMLLGLVSNANAQGPGFPVAVGVGQNPTGAALVLYYPYNEEIAPLTLPMATGGTAPLTYSLPILSNLRFDPATRVLTGAPNVAGGGYFTPDGFPFTYTVTDGAGLTDTVNVHLNVCESGGDDTGTTICTPPSFTPYSIASPPMNMTYTVNAPINVTLPAATGGTGIEPFRRYALLGAGADVALPAGLTFDTTSRVLSGTPSAVGNTTVRYRVGEVAGFNPEERAAYFDFTLIVEADTTPVFTPDAAISAQSYFPGQMLDMTLPSAIGGNGAITYMLTGPGGAALAQALPGATLNPTTRVLSGMLTATPAAARVFTYTATDAENDVGMLTFNITVYADSAPTFTEGATIADQLYIVGERFPLTLPAVTTGTGNIRINYALTPALPAGLTFNDELRPPTLTGTPTTVAATTTYTYMITDGDTNTGAGDSDSLEFDLTVEENTFPAFPEGTAIPDQNYIQHTMITPLTLPQTATGGNGPLTYTLSSGLPVGLTYNADANPPTITGTPTGTAGRVRIRWMAADADIDIGQGDTAIVRITFVVAANISPTFTEGVTIGDQIYLVGETVALTLPEAAPGNGATHYGLANTGTFMVVADGESLLGLTWNAAERTLTGTATTGTIPLLWIARDTDESTSDTASLPFRITVEADTVPSFAIGETIDLRTYVAGTMIAPLTFPQATGGNGDLTYMLTPSLPAGLGLTFDGAANPPTLTGMPTAAASVTYTYTAADADSNMAGDDTASLTFDLTVEVDTAPTFPDGTVVLGDVLFAQNVPFPPLTLPTTATGGNGPLTYALTNSAGAVATLHAGLTYNAAANPPTITGTPTQLGAFLLNWVAMDADGNELRSDTARVNFVISIRTDIVPAFAEGVTIADQFYLPGEEVALTLPAVAMLGNRLGITFGPDITYRLVNRDTGMAVADGGSVLGLTWNAADRTLTGTTTVGTIPFSLIAQDADENTEADDTASLEFDLTVADTAPAFATGETIDLKTYVTDTMIAPLTFPQATGGNGDLTYMLTPSLPAGLGLTFDGAARPPTLTGTPPVAAASVTYTYTAADADGNIAGDDTASLAFDLTVEVDTAPTFPEGTVVLGDVLFAQNVPLPTLTLPTTATGGNGPITYALVNSLDEVATLHAGLTYNAAANPPTITGTPTQVNTLLLNWVAIDADDNELRSDTARVVFSLAVKPDIVPAFAEGVTIADQFYLPGEEVALTLPAVAMLGNRLGITFGPDITYRLVNRDTGMAVADGESVLGLIWNAADRTLTGTATLGTIPFSWIAQDADENTGADDTASLGFRITVEVDTTPAFADNAMIPEQIYTRNSTIPTLVFPQATGGNGDLTYILTPSLPAGLGLTFDGATRQPILTGRPTAVTGSVTYTYTAADADGNIAPDDAASLTFDLTVEADTAPTFPDGTVTIDVLLHPEHDDPHPDLADDGHRRQRRAHLRPDHPGRRSPEPARRADLQRRRQPADHHRHADRGDNCTTQLEGDGC